MSETDFNLLSLYAEYAALVDRMRGGRYTEDEMHALDSERQILHYELIRQTGYTDPHFDMYQYARNALYDARRHGWI